MLKNLALGWTLVLSFSAAAMNHGIFYHKQSLLMQSNDPRGQALKLRADGSMRSEEVGYYKQRLDHTDPTSATFNQRFFVDSQYAISPSAPVFYIICGEWNCAGTGSYSYVESLAKKFNAHLVALEHRFYGESLPTRNLRATNLEHLHLQAAIDDLATFQKHMMKERGFNGRWVAFGGSYAGTLAAFYREKHPELVAGALASSAPVLMKNEFFEYDAHVAKVVNKTSCGNKIRQAVKLIEKRLKTSESAKEVKALFKASNVVHNGDFLYVVADMLAAAVQYGRDKVFCNALEGSQDLVEGYAKGGLSVLSSMGTSPYEISLAVAEREIVTPEDNMRQWMWQSCQEFGWFQVANGTGSDTSRSSQIDLAYHDEVCKRLYQKPMGVDGALNADWYYPLANPETSRIIFSNGSNDPWLTLSIIQGGELVNPSFDLFMMAGAAHCNDLNRSNLSSVLGAQGQMATIIAEWIK